jgi:chromatin segregation and condensation protein Rec8/ScpA/Scc1 (kleisin family)
MSVEECRALAVFCAKIARLSSDQTERKTLGQIADRLRRMANAKKKVIRQKETARSASLAKDTRARARLAELLPLPL